MRFKDMQRELSRMKREANAKDQLIKRQRDAIDDLKRYVERHYDYNMIDIVIRPQRQDFLHPYQFDIDMWVDNGPTARAIGFRRVIDLTTLDLIRDKEDFIRRISEIMIGEILAFANK